jgi:hypothetical protein
VVSVDLSFALMRLDQIEARLAEDPMNAHDQRLQGLLRSLRDDLSDQKVIAESD